MRLHSPGLHGNRPKAFQGRNSRLYDLLARSLFRRLYRTLARDIATVAPAGATVLDVGTGPGVLLAELAHLRPDLTLTGVDLSADMVTAARRNLTRYAGRATAQVGNVTALDFPDGSFDLVVSTLSLHHWDHPEAALGELARILRPGGQVYIYDFWFAPFDKLVSAARNQSVLSGQTPSRTAVRTGIPFLPRCVRLIMSGKAVCTRDR